jgi:tetratricopeptide (TPR) repeat protein
LFEEFDHWYGEEPETRENDFREKQLRLWGLAALQAGLNEKGEALLLSWLDENPSPAKYHAFIRFQLASSLAYTGKLDEAVSQWNAFIKENPDLPETALVHWKLADYRISQSQWLDGEAQLQSALAHPHLPASGRALVKAALAILAINRDNNQIALDWLLSMDAGLPVEKLWQALVAPSLASRMMAQDHSAEALRITSWFTQPMVLEKDLSRLLNGKKARSSLRQKVWDAHWQQQADLIEASIRKSIASGDLESSQYRLKLSSLRQCDMARHSLVLAQALLESALPVADSLRSTAYSEAIKSCHVFQDWIQADTLANAFLEAFPGHPDLPDILYLQAKSAAGRGETENALNRIDRLIDSYPNHRSLLRWKLSEAAWTLEDRRAADAWELYSQLATTAPDGWIPFLKFQQGRCKESLREFETARSDYEAGFSHSLSTPALQEQALVALLKLHLQTLDGPNFDRILSRYRSTFTQGLNRMSVEILAATWLRQTGRLAEAIDLLETLVQDTDPAALMAYRLLSEIHRQKSDAISLARIASNQISRLIESENKLPELPFNDLLHAQGSLQQPVLDEFQVRLLLNLVNGHDAKCPDLLLLHLVTGQWHAYRELLNLPTLPVEKWLEQQAMAHLERQMMRAYASYNLLLADWLEKRARSDSADARRIQVLQSVHPDSTGEHANQVLALTAAAYNFPEAERLLERFTQKYPLSVHRPGVLLELARIQRNRNMDTIPLKLLEEIRDDWPDSTVFPWACILLSKWLDEDGYPDNALATLTGLLDMGNLSPKLTAEAILLRAKLLFRAGDTKKGYLNCQRLLQLYPAFQDIAESARQLINNNPLPDDA